MNRLVKISVIGEVVSPTFHRSPYRISSEGQPVVLPGKGGITYNVRVGDSAVAWMADHVEPGVSIKNKEKDERSSQEANYALNFLSCVGNEAVVVSGDVKGKKGVVTGKHGGAEHVLIDFSEEVLERLIIGDKIMVKAFGVGLRLLDFPEVKAMNLDPNFLEAIKLKGEKGVLEVPVTHKVPARVMGSGLGADNVYSGDYDIQLFDEDTEEEYGLEDLRLGDLVAIIDSDHSYGRIYKKGAISVGIIVHTDCVISGHGPGITTLFTSSRGKIIPRIKPTANIVDILKLR